MKSANGDWYFSFQVELWPHLHHPYSVVDEILSSSCAGNKHFSPAQRKEWVLRTERTDYANLALYIHPLFFPTLLCPQRSWHTRIAPYMCWLSGFWLHLASEKKLAGNWKKRIKLGYVFLWNPLAKLPCRLVVYSTQNLSSLQTALFHIVLFPGSGNCSPPCSLAGFHLFLASGHPITSL